jgi:serine/threonine protein kinase
VLPIESQLEVESRAGTVKYVPRAKLACGGMAEVWRGEAHLSDGQIVPVAFKRVLPELADSPLYRRLLEDEARVGNLLRHPNIVRVYDSCELNGSFVLVMELVEGASLRDVFRHLQSIGARVPLSASLCIARSLALALAAGHDAVDEWGRELSIVHCDVSPHNVLLAEDGSVKLMDFGLASSVSKSSLRPYSAHAPEGAFRPSSPGDGERLATGGKPGYLAPELILLREVSPAIDLFALGVVLWECLTGQRLFHGRDEEETSRKIVRCDIPPPSKLVPDLPRELDELLALLLAREPERRHGSARELAAELEYLAVRYGRRGSHLLGRAELRELVAWTTAGVPRRHSDVREAVRVGPGQAPEGLEAAPFEEERDSGVTRPRNISPSTRR